MTKLAVYMKEKCVSLRPFANKIGTTPTHLGRIVRGQAQAGLRLAYAIEKQTNGEVKMEDLIIEENT